MNVKNMRLALNTIKERIAYLEREIDNAEGNNPAKTEKGDIESAIGYIKAKARKALTGGKVPLANTDIILINEVKAQFKGLWGKNVMASLFEDIAKRSPKEFRYEKAGKTTYLIPQK